MALETRWVRYGKDQEYIGYMAKIDKVTESIPAVIVIQEIWGVDEHIQDLTRRFAQAGYCAFAPDLYARYGERMEDLRTERIEEVKAFLNTLPRALWTDPKEREKALQKMDEEKQNRISRTFERMFGGMKSPEYIEQLLATSAFLREENEFSRNQGVASVGFCMGGTLSALLACRDSRLKGAVIFYGEAPAKEELQNAYCPLLGFYGELDHKITDAVPEVADFMKQRGKAFEYHIYGGAHHAFFNDTRPAYNVTAVRDAYSRTLQFLNQVLS